MADAKRIRQGAIVWADVRDPSGKPVGGHPAVVLTAQAEIDAGVDLRVAVCTTTFSYPLRSGWFDVPTKPGGHKDTGLAEACVVKATWLQIVPQLEVSRVAGRLPARIFRQIQAWIASKAREAKDK